MNEKALTTLVVNEALGRLNSALAAGLPVCKANEAALEYILSELPPFANWSKKDFMSYALGSHPNRKISSAWMRLVMKVFLIKSQNPEPVTQVVPYVP